MKVKVYTTPTCPYCKMTKEFLKEKGVDFEELDVAGDDDARKEMVQKSGQMGVPVVQIKDELIVGFDKDAIEEALKKNP